MPTPEELDAITPDACRAAGHLKWTKFGPDRLGAFVAEMDFGTAPAVTAALHEAVERGQLGYLSPPIADAMGAACASWQGATYGWAVPPERISPLPDVMHGIEIAIEHFSRPGSPVILPVPAYMPFVDVAPRQRRATLPIEMVRDGARYVYDLDALDAAFRAGGHLLVLCNPYNPLGRVMEAAELDAIATVVDRHGGRVFADEIHAPLVFTGRRHVPYASRSDTTAAHTITATSASKAWNLAGLNCAQLIVSNDADRARLEELVPLLPHVASTLGAIASTAAYDAGGPWLADIRAYLDGNRALLAELLAAHLPAVGYTPQEGTYLAWLDCRALGLPDALDEFFLERAGVGIVDGGAAAATAAPASYGSTSRTSRPILTRIVERLASAVRADGA